MRRRGVMALLAGAAVLLTGCGLAGESYPAYRYRLTVEVDTPEGLRAGSSVIEVKTGVGGPAAGPMAVVEHRMRGEAVVVDLGKQGPLFVLLASPWSQEWASQAMTLGVVPRPSRAQRDKMKDVWRETIRAQLETLRTMKGVYDLPRTVNIGDPQPVDNYPYFVRFQDLRDPKTVERVDPDNLAASFGKGVKLRRITVQLTDDPVTTGIEKRLGWLGIADSASLDRDFDPTTNPTLAQTLNFLDFRQVYSK